MRPEDDSNEPQTATDGAEETAAPADAAGADAAGAEADAAALAAAQAEAAEMKDRLLRTAAEMENLRKRNERQLEEAHKYAVTGFARDMLAVADNLQRALAAVPAEQRGGNDLMETLLGGVEAVEKELLTILEKHNISRIDPLGEPFDPNRHEAVFEVPTGDYPAGTVAQVLQPGYMLNDRLLRPAMVGVAKGAAAGAQAGIDTTV